MSYSATFEKIYQNWGFGGDESRSGPGSTLGETAAIRKYLLDLKERHHIKSVLDVPCGDFNWMRLVAPKLDSYIGGDISPSAVEANKQNYPTFDFRVIDILEDELPKVDLIICRDVFGHMPLEYAEKGLKRIREAGIRYILTTSWIKLDENGGFDQRITSFENKNIETFGRFYPVSVFSKPFHYPTPVECMIEDVRVDRYDEGFRKALCLFDTTKDSLSPTIYSKSDYKMKNDLTIVTGLFNLGRDKLEPGFRRGFDHYIECFRKFLTHTNHLALVVYTEKEYEHIVWDHRSRENTRVVIRDLDWLRAFPFYDQVQRIRTSPEWRGQAGWIPDSPQSALELYNPLVMSKHFMLNDATIFNFFESNHYLWLDAGLSNTVNLESYIKPDFARRVIPHLNKMMYVCFPYDGQVEVHGFPKRAMNQYAGEDTKWVARGGVFGGSKDYINTINAIYYNLLNTAFNEGYMGTEESIFTLITYRHKDLCNINMIEGNGLVYKFFDDINKQALPPPPNEKLAAYVLTFNMPKQFKLWAESFRKVYPKEFANLTRYVINNSTDASLDAEYQDLFKEYGFTEFKFDNIGICGGRQFAAEHFATTNHEFMVFFEDDMLFHEPGAVCKAGFTTHHAALLDKAMMITRNEALDYLKLSFSEFYGDNHDNWAWYNVPEGKKKDYFPVRTDGVSSKKVRIEYTGTYRGLPYAIGEYHYCNWPLMFSQAGNKKVFLDTKWEHKFEQTWMSHVMNLLRSKVVKAGCLLASPINHHRKYHYDGKSRRENEKYKN